LTGAGEIHDTQAFPINSTRRSFNLLSARASAHRAFAQGGRPRLGKAASQTRAMGRPFAAYHNDGRMDIFILSGTRLVGDPKEATEQR